MFRSTDVAVGRTGWDFLESSKFLILIVLGIVVLACLLVFRPELFSGIGEAWDAYKGYLLPVGAGIWVGRWLYMDYLRRYVVIQVEDPKGNLQCEYEVSEGYFSRLRVVGGGILNPVTTGIGVPMYRVLELDTENGTIRPGDCHRPEWELANVMSVRDNWESLVSHDREMTTRVMALEEVRYQESMSYGREIASKLLDVLGMPSMDKKAAETKEQVSEGDDGDVSLR